MIVNDFHKFIFVHIPKSAGSSMTKALKRLPGNNSDLTNHKTKHETLAEFFQEAGKRCPPPADTKEVAWQSYFKFGFVRNPWDRIASLYAYLQEAQPRPEIKSINSFAQFLEEFDAGEKWIAKLRSMRPQHEFFLDESGKMAADFIGCHEMLGEDFNQLQKHFGISLSLPHANKSSNSERDYRSNYSDKLVEIVGRRFAADISYFGYQFEVKVPALNTGFKDSKIINNPANPG